MTEDEGDVIPSFDELMGANIQRYRTAAGLSQAELAETLSESGEQMHQQTIQKIEKGARPLRLSEALRIAGVLGVSIEVLARPTPETDTSLRVQSRNRAVLTAARSVEESIARLSDELLKLAVVYARAVGAEQKPSAVIAERAKSLLDHDWALSASLIDRLGGEPGDTARQVLSRVIERAAGYDEATGLLAENAVIGVDRI